MRQTAASRLALVLSAGLAAAAGSARGELTEVPVDLRFGVGTRNNNLIQFQLEAAPRWDVTHGDRGNIVASARLRLDGRDLLEPGEPKFENYAPLSKPITLGDAGTLEIRDLYYEHLLDRGRLRFGKQQIVWGLLDGVKILDVVNPQTFREFILDDLEDSRIGLWSAYADLSFGEWRAEFVVIPDNTSHDIPDQGAWFELKAPRFRYGAPVGSSGLPSYVERDGDGFSDLAAGVRLSTRISSVDISALAYSGQDHAPLGRLTVDNGTAAIEQFFRRRDVLGVSAESAFGPIAWRTELAHQPDRTFNTRDFAGLDTVELDQTTLGVGADVALPLDVLANVQVVWDQVHDAPATLVRPDEDKLFTLFLRRSFAYETLRTELRWYHSLTDHDDTIVATVSYDISDETSAYVSSEWFSGTPEGLFGQFAAQDRIYLGLAHYF